MLKSNKEEQEWLKQLQKDLIEDRLAEKGNASPLYYGLQQPFNQIVPDGYGDTIEFFDEDAQESITLEQLWNNFTQEEKQEMDNDYLDTGVSYNEETNEYEIANLSDFINHINQSTDYETFETEIQQRIVTDALFLTRKDANDYLQKYGYNHPKNTVSYAMTAVRSPRYEHLLELLHNIDWDASDIVLKQKAKPMTQAQLKKEAEKLINESNRPKNMSVKMSCWMFVRYLTKILKPISNNIYEVTDLSKHLDDWFAAQPTILKPRSDLDNIPIATVIENHRKMWDWIEQETRRRRKKITKEDYAYEINDCINQISANCWLCEYADNCRNCMLKWDERNGTCQATADGYPGLYTKWGGAMHWRTAADLAHQIANLNER